MAGAATEVLFNHIAMHVDSDYIYTDFLNAELICMRAWMAHKN